jgi:hypothetical protein
MDKSINFESPNYLEMLTHLRNDYSDEIPNEIINSTSENPLYKVRRAWFDNIIRVIHEMAMGYYFMDDTTELDKFSSYFTSPEFQVRSTTADDIARGNEVLDYLISVVKKRESIV